MTEQLLRMMPVGVSDWRRIQRGDKFYVDKTPILSKLVRGLDKIFIARPRRMGKTTLISMLEELFTNGDKNFEGTAIYGQWPEKDTYPVINLNFMEIHGMAMEVENQKHKDWASTQSYADSFTHTLRNSLKIAFTQGGFLQAEEINNKCANFGDFLQNLAAISKEQDLVFLIDEWDFPLSINLDNEDRFKAILVILRKFYIWLRTLKNIRFIFVTGIMRYHETSLFTGKDIQDISMELRWSNLMGVTNDELTLSYDPYIEIAAERLHCSKVELVAKLKRHYDGFCFDDQAQTKLYCPFSLNKFFEAVALDNLPNELPVFGDYWMKCADAVSALGYLLQSRKIDLPQMMALKEQDVTLTYDELSEPQYFSQVQILPLLVEAGYLSIKEVIPPAPDSDDELSFRCGITNLEVATDFLKAIKNHAKAKIKVSKLEGENSPLRKDLCNALEQGDIPRFCARLNELLYDISYEAFINVSEALYRAFILIYLREIFSKVREETHNSQGRSDIEVETDHGHVYVFELKLIECGARARDLPEGTPEIDLEQVNEQCLIPAKKQMLSRGYGVNAYTHGAPVTGVVLAIGAVQRRIVAWRSLTPEGEKYDYVPAPNIINKHVAPQQASI